MHSGKCLTRVPDLLSFSSKKLRKKEFIKFLTLVKQRKPESSDKIVAANELIEGIISNSDPHAQITLSHPGYHVATSTSGLKSPEMASAPPEKSGDLREAAFAEEPAYAPSTLS